MCTDVQCSYHWAFLWRHSLDRTIARLRIIAYPAIAKGRGTQSCERSHHRSKIANMIIRINGREHMYMWLQVGCTMILNSVV